jgi:hypothetical protein
MTATAPKPRQLFLRLDPQIDELIDMLCKRRRVRRSAWIRDALNLAIDLEMGTRSE